MKHFLLIFLITLTRRCTVRSQTFDRQVSCPNEPTLTGYTDLAALNEDMLEELTRLQGGGSAPSGGYLLQLCPGETFSVSESGAMQIVLDDVTIRCGFIDASDTCILDGNDEQVVVHDSAEEGYTITNVTLSGITFDGLETDGVAISLDVSPTAEFRCVDCTFQDFDSAEYLVLAIEATTIVMENTLIQSTNPENPASVNEALIESPGGTVILRDIVVTDVSAEEDFFRISGGGTMIISEADLSGNIVKRSIVRAEEGASLQFNDTTISENDFEGDVIYAVGVATSIVLSDVTMNNNAGNAWTGVFIGGGASAEILDSSFASNRGLQYMVTAQQMDSGGASISIQRSDFTNNESDTVADPTSLVSAIGFNSGTPAISMLRVDFKRNSGFTSNFMTLTGGTFDVRQACFDNNFNLFVAFLGTGGQEFIAENNYVSRRETSQGCTGSQKRLAIESEDSGNCFTESETACFVDCSPGLEDADECLFDVEIEPSAQPSSVSSGETTSPSSQPTLNPPGSSNPSGIPSTSNVPTQSNRPTSPTDVPSAQPSSQSQQPTTGNPTEFEIPVSPSMFPSVWFPPITNHPTIFSKPTPKPTSSDSGKGKGKDTGTTSKGKGKDKSKSSKGSSKATKGTSKDSKGTKGASKKSSSSSSSDDKPTSRPTPGPTQGRVIIDRGGITSSTNYWSAIGGASGVYRLYNFDDSTAETAKTLESSGGGILFIGE